MKKFIVLILSAIILVAISVSWYNVSANKAFEETNLTSETPNAIETSIAFAKNQPSDIPESFEAPGLETAVPNPEISPAESAELLDSNALDNQLPPTSASSYSAAGRQGGQTYKNNTGLNNNQELITISGIVGSFVAPQLTLTTSDGQNVVIQVGNFFSADGTALNLVPGEQITITGWYNSTGSLTANQILVDASGVIFTASRQSGRPEWAGKGQGNPNK